MVQKRQEKRNKRKKFRMDKLNANIRKTKNSRHETISILLNFNKLHIQ